MSKTIYIPHGGGPMPLLDREGHKNLIGFYEKVAKNYHPKAIVVFSAHFESDPIEVMYDNGDDLVYDYYGFPREAYEYQYKPPKDIALGERIVDLLNKNGIETVSSKRGFDHGVYVPLMIMYPKADIPVIQVSLKRGLDERFHIALGQAFQSLKNEDILFIGSGFSFHNLRAFFTTGEDERNEAFQQWLVDLLENDDIEESERKTGLINWESAPYARYVHPRSEHFIPLFICYGIHQRKGEVIFDDYVTGKRSIAVVWD